MQIKYRFMRGSLLKTNCPYKTSCIVGGKEIDVIPKVGSGACKECEFFGGVDAEKQIVECNYET
jgi:hypothetical protein